MKGIAFICSLGFLLTTFCGLQAQVDLGYRLAVGDSFQIKQNAHQLMVQTLEGTTHELTNELEGLFTFVVTAKTDFGYELKLTFDDFALKSSSSLQGVLMDVRATEKVEGDLMSAIFSSLVGYELLVKMKPNGKLIAVEGGDALIDRMVSAAGIDDEFTKSLMKKSLERDFSTESLSQSFEQMTYLYPETSVGIGDSWQNNFDGKLQANTTWTLEKIEQGTLSITAKASVVMAIDDESIKMDLEGAQETALQASDKSGFLKKMMVSGSAKGSSYMAQAKEVEIPTTMESTITYELIK